MWWPFSKDRALYIYVWSTTALHDMYVMCMCMCICTYIQRLDVIYCK